MTDSERHALELVRATLRLGQGVPVQGPDCLSEDLIAAVVDGTVDPERRSSALDHLASCAHCRSVVASVSRAVSDPEVTAALPPSRRRRTWLTVPAAAAAGLLLLLLGPSGDEPVSPLHRSVTSNPDQPSAVAPLGEAFRPAWLRWHSVPDADLYRVTLFDRNGRPLYEIELRDTAAALPDSIHLVPGHRYLWKVDARTDWERWSASPLFEFSVRGNGAP